MALNLRGEPIRLSRPTAGAEKTSSDLVTMSLQADDESGDPPKIVSAEMTVEEARDLAIRLWLAADK